MKGMMAQINTLTVGPCKNGCLPPASSPHPISSSISISIAMRAFGRQGLR